MSCVLGCLFVGGEMKDKLCSCGCPQSHPIPHEHDLSIREAAIIAYYKDLNADLLDLAKNVATGVDIDQNAVQALVKEIEKSS